MSSGRYDVRRDGGGVKVCGSNQVVRLMEKKIRKIIT